MHTPQHSALTEGGPTGPAAGAGWPRRALGGAIGAVVSVAIVLTLGVVALSPLGVQSGPVGIPAAFATVVVSAALFAVLSRSLMAAGSPSSATSLIAAGLVAQVASAESASGAEAVVPAVVLTLGAAVALMGLLQLLMAAAHLGRLARYVPQPVLAGFMNGVAVLIALAQLPPLLNLAPELWRTQGPQALAMAQGGSLALGLGTAALVWLLAWRVPRAPAALLGLLAGLLVFHASQWAAPALALGATLGPVALPHTLPGLLTLWERPVAGLAVLQRHAAAVALTAVVLALIGTLESMLNFRATDQQFGGRHDERRDLLALGLSNLLGGLLGALPMVQVRARAAAIVQAGGRGRVAGLGAAAASALIFGFGGPWFGQLPQTVLAGVMVTVAVSLVDPVALRLLLRGWLAGPAVRTSLLIMALVCVLTVWQGVAAGVAAGVALSTVIFIRGMNRSLLRARLDAGAHPSRRVYPPPVEQLLSVLRRRVVILELEGALFFGTAERVADEAEGLRGDTRFLVLDLRRVNTIDESAATVLRRLQSRLQGRGVGLLLAGVGPGSTLREQLQLHPGAAPTPGDENWFPDSDHAVEFAERRLLAEHPEGVDALDASHPLVQSRLLAGLTSAQRTAVSRHLQACHLKAGERLFSEGDPGLGLYVLTRGSVSVVNASGQRYSSFSPDTIVGELAMLDGRGRSADAIADRDSELHLLTREALDALAAVDPLLCAQLYRNIAVHLAERLRAASDAWRRAET
ncbi:MAG: SulP family inorganic anion transporter [Rubrivivax sp.]|nr:SulP family inorganic anion transporter [Rubrivivax sp.]